ncbi:hypothetical protein F4805DRAFT_418145 [Annulohypoxylon moriforme]|nr:hypothetical protein F4805DRAFT_418145 [Annulohypoxylon moriforme]
MKSGPVCLPRPGESAPTRPIRPVDTVSPSETTPLLPEDKPPAPLSLPLNHPAELILIAVLFFICSASCAVLFTVIGAAVQTIPYWVSGEEAPFSAWMCLTLYLKLTALGGALGCVMETIVYVECVLFVFCCGEGRGGGIISRPYYFPVLEVWCIALIVPWIAMHPWPSEGHVRANLNIDNDMGGKAVREHGDIN